ncbi:MAG TPA: sensor histidine kinase [Methylomirabilota bacterium]|jgi:signal transduction histidine kinase|nr:sensor histidine kinase [Methylomirabilota bacterium]
MRRGEALQYSPQSHAERLIVTGRVVLAAFSFVALWLDPSEPARHAATAYALVALYVCYALLLALLVWRAAAPSGRLRLATHAADLAIFSLFMYFTEGPNSPFFLFFVFALVCAALRWQWRGTLWTAAAALAAFIAMGAYAGEVLRDPAFELNRFIMRSAYLAVVAALVAYLGAHEHRVRREMSRLAAWPSDVPPDARALLHETVQHAAEVLGAPRLLMVWEEADEPWTYLASWSGGEFRWTREPPDAFPQLVAEPLAGTHFLCPDATAPVPIVLHTSAAGFQRWRGKLLDTDLQTRFAIGPVLGASLRGGHVTGYLLALDKRRMTSDDLVLGEIVAHQAVTHMEQFYLLQRLQQTAATEERIRLSRDLHDGLLQSLTGIALHLESVRRQLDAEPEAARQRLREIQELITAEQRDLRAFIGQLKPVPVTLQEVDASLAARLAELCELVQRQWGVRVELSMDRLDGHASEALAQEIYWIAHEALVNAARHARATVVRVAIQGESRHVRLLVADNGRGFPFSGRYDLPALTEEKLGPRTLKERIAALQGSLNIDSTGAGARLDIRLPLVRSGVWDGD